MADPHRAAGAVGAGVLLALGLAVFAPTLQVRYVSDDYPHLAAIEAEGWSPFDAMPAGTGAYVRPLLMGSMAAERVLAGDDAAPLHHAVNLAIHIAAALLLYALVLALRPRDPAAHPTADPGALFALGLAALLLVHPAQVDDVAWIAGRQDTLVGIAFLAGVLGLVEWARSGRAGWLALPAVALPVALFAKESGAMYAPALALAWAAILRVLPAARGRGALVVPLVAGLAAATAGWALWVWLEFYRGAGSLPGADPRNAAEVLLTFPALLVLPHRQTVLIEAYRASPWILPIGLIVAGALAAFLVRRARRAGVLVLAALLAGLVLLQLAPYVAAGGLNARRAYAPIAALAVALALAGRRWPRAASRLAPALVVLAALATVPAARHAGTWARAQRAADRWCASFREVATWPPGEPYTLVAWPYAMGEVPVWSNDAAAALHHCRTGRFEAPFDAVLGVPLYGTGRLPEAPVITARRGGPDRVLLEIEDRAFRPGPTRNWQPAAGDAVRALRRRPGGSAQAEIHAPDSVPAVWFDGTGFQRVGGTALQPAGTGGRLPQARALAGRAVEP